MNVTLYILAFPALFFLLFFWLGIRLLKAGRDAEDALSEVAEALNKRDLVTLDLLRLVEPRIPAGTFPTDDIRRYGKLTAVSKIPSDKAINAELCRNSLADFLKLLKDYPEITQDLKFIDICVELRKSENDIDVSVLRYNNMVFLLNRLVPKPLLRAYSRIFRIKTKQFFSKMAPSYSANLASGQRSKVWDLADAFISAIGSHTTVRCSCGLEINVPAYFKGDKVLCQLCGSYNTVPEPELRAAGAILNAPPLSVGKKTVSSSLPSKQIMNDRGWGRLHCSCGNVTQLSPGFQAPYVKCPSCGKKYLICMKISQAQRLKRLNR